MSTSTKTKVSFLELVYPPISNQEAVWMQADPDVEALARQSDFYMIAGRAEAKYEDITVDPEAREIRFRYTVGDTFSDPVILKLDELPTIAGRDDPSFWIEAGQKMIRIWTDEPESEGAELLDWFTTEKLLWERARGRAGIVGFDNFRNAATYDLLYVGIAKVGDSFDRLIKNGHKARMEILSNEPQRYPGARVTDETYLFLFKVEPLITTTFEPDHVFTGEELNPDYEPKRIVADAEKAFVSLLKPQYNVQKFANYPKGKDGLYEAGFARYGYSLCENLSFNTAHGRFHGGRDPRTGFISNEGDAIFVQGDEVKLLISGVDFLADYGPTAATAAQSDGE